MAKTKDTEKEAPKKSTAPAKSTGKKTEPAPAPAKSKKDTGSKDKTGDKEKTKSKTKTNPYEEGQILVFDGYSEKVKNPVFEKGDYIRVLEIKSPEKFTAERIQLQEGEDETAADTCFVAETHTPTDEEQVEIDAILEESEDEEGGPYDAEADDEDADEEGGTEADADDDDEEESEDDEDSDEDDSEDAEDSDEEDADDDGDDSEDEDEEEEEAPAKSKSKKNAAPAKSDTKSKKTEPAPAKSKSKKKDDEEEGEDEGEEEEPAVELTESAKAIIEDSGGDALEAVKAVKGRMNKDVVDMGVLLSHIHANNVHASLMEGTGKKAKPRFAPDKKGFTKYVKQELDLEPRVAYGYMAVARLASTFGIDSETVAKIGWTKLQQICDIANDGNIKALLKQAAKLNREDLVNHIRETYTDKGEGSGKRKKSDDKTKKLKLTVEVFGDQAELVRSAVADAKEEIGAEDDGKALVHIIQEWAAMKNGGEDAEDTEDEDEGDDSDSEEEEEEEAPKKKSKGKK